MVERTGQGRGRRRGLALLMALAGVAAGCGSTGDEPVGGSPTTEAAPAPVSVAVSAPVSTVAVSVAAPASTAPVSIGTGGQDEAEAAATAASAALDHYLQGPMIGDELSMEELSSLLGTLSFGDTAKPAQIHQCFSQALAEVRQAVVDHGGDPAEYSTEISEAVAVAGPQPDQWIVGVFGREHAPGLGDVDGPRYLLLVERGKVASWPWNCWKGAVVPGNTVVEAAAAARNLPPGWL